MPMATCSPTAGYMPPLSLYRRSALQKLAKKTAVVAVVAVAVVAVAAKELEACSSLEANQLAHTCTMQAFGGRRFEPREVTFHMVLAEAEAKSSADRKQKAQLTATSESLKKVTMPGSSATTWWGWLWWSASSSSIRGRKKDPAEQRPAGCSCSRFDTHWISMTG